LRAWALVPAAGAGRRMGGGIPKQFLSLQGRPLLAWALGALAAWRGLRGMVVVAPPEDMGRVRTLIDENRVGGVLRIVAGGEERQDSVRLGLDGLREAVDDDLVLIHDGVRPFPRFTPSKPSAKRPTPPARCWRCLAATPSRGNGGRLLRHRGPNALVAGPDAPGLSCGVAAAGPCRGSKKGRAVHR